jgi:hypothetical protein
MVFVKLLLFSFLKLKNNIFLELDIFCCNLTLITG